METQAKQILAHLRRYDHITSMEAIQKYGVTRLAACIFDLKEFVLDELSEKNLSMIPGIKPTEVTKLINEHMNGSWNRYPTIWKLLVLKDLSPLP